LPRILGDFLGLIANFAEMTGICSQPSLGSRFHGKKTDVILWPQGQFAAISTARFAAKADNEIRDLVASLEAARKECLQ
jgi:hypothetical protein